MKGGNGADAEFVQPMTASISTQKIMHHETVAATTKSKRSPRKGSPTKSSPRKRSPVKNAATVKKSTTGAINEEIKE